MTYNNLGLIEATTSKLISEGDWAQRLCFLVEAAIFDVLSKSNACNIMLTGGRSAEHLYKLLNNSIAFSLDLTRLNFYFGDERCVPPCNKESNYRLAVDTLFSGRLLSDIRIYRIEAEASDLLDVAKRYEERLPKSIDILLLSLGGDGHIASLFPFGPYMHEGSRSVVPASSGGSTSDRVTITPLVIQRAHHVFVMAIGQEKRAIYEAALLEPDNIDAIPARLVLDRTWIFGEW